jgi:hypothetical protein
MSNCTSGCKTQDHASYGECLRSKSMAVMGLESTGNDYTANKRMHAENAAYKAARAEGLSPTMRTMASVDVAKRKADTTGMAE